MTLIDVIILITSILIVTSVVVSRIKNRKTITCGSGCSCTVASGCKETRDVNG